jgi:hypothetical protein
MSKWIKVMADYGSIGLWNERGYGVDLDSIDLDPYTIFMLGAWVCRYESQPDTFDWRSNTGDAAHFVQYGLKIAQRIKNQHPDWMVFYFNEGTCETHAILKLVFR